MAWARYCEQVLDCLSHAATPVPKDDMEKVIDMVRNVEDAGGAGRMVHLLAYERVA